MMYAIRPRVGQAVARMRRRFAVRGAILLYHRIARVAIDPWGLCVTPENFDAQLQLLCKQYHVLPLADMVAAFQCGMLPRRAVSITFDDGYADNHHVARPLLEKYGLPATFFIATGYIGQRREFWWDELERAVLRPGTLPAKLALEIGNTRFERKLGPAARFSPGDAQQLRQAKPWEADPATRIGFFYSLWQQLYPLSHTQRQPILAQIAAWAGTDPGARPDYCAMTVAELQDFARSPVVTIGGHTVTHPALAAHDPSVQQTEIQAGIDTLTALLQRPVQLFSYPHGDYSPATVELVRGAGSTAACTVEAEPVWRGSNAWRLPRFGVEDWPQAEFAVRLARWLQ